jgi:FkbM family methyltransferase
MSKKLTAGRTRVHLLRALMTPRHYRAALAALVTVRYPLPFLFDYAVGAGRYPSTVAIRTPIGTVSLVVNSWHDLRTIHEIFCAGDYLAEPSDQIVVDYGSNIGVSAAYFLSRSKDSFAYLFEPLPKNLETLRLNLDQFANRYEVHDFAIGLEDGQLEFGWEPTGRLGGLGQKTGNYILVDVRKSRDILSRVIEERGRIDVLKIDIETLEREVTEDLPQDILVKIGKIYVEYRFTHNPLSRTHDMNVSGTIACFVRKPQAP